MPRDGEPGPLAGRRRPRPRRWRTSSSPASGPAPASRSSSANRAKDGDKTADCPVVVESSCGLGRVWLTAFDLDGRRSPPSGRGPQGLLDTMSSPSSRRRPAAAVDPGQPERLSAGQRAAGAAGRDAALPGELRERARRQLRLGGPVHPHLHRHRRPARLLPPQEGLQAARADLDHVPRRRADRQRRSPTSSPTTSRATICASTRSISWNIDLHAPSRPTARPGSRCSARASRTTPSAWSRRRRAGRRRRRTTRPRTPSRSPTLANPDLGRRRAASPSLFRQPYAYAEDASGLERVPIPVWSTRSFHGVLARAVDPASPPSGRRDRQADPDFVRRRERPGQADRHDHATTCRSSCRA